MTGKPLGGIPSESSLNKDIQAITYCAALCQMTGAEEAEFVWWNIRWKTGNILPVQVSRRVAVPGDTSLGFMLGEGQVSKPKPLRWMSVQENTVAVALIQTSAWWSFLTTRKATTPSFYQYAERLAALTRKVKAELKIRLKERTSTVQVPGGTTLGPGVKTYNKWKRGQKEEGMRKVLETLTQGTPLTDVFDIKGSLKEWLGNLPEELRSYVEEHVESASRQVLIEKEK